MATIGEFTVKQATDIRDDILRTIRNGLLAQGVANPNVGPNSDFYVLATAFANEMVVLSANLIIKSDSQMPDTATGTDLDRIGAIVGVGRRNAAGSVGFITFTASAASLVASGTQLIDGKGQRFQVSVGGIYNNNDIIPIQAIDVGASTNHSFGDVLRWVSAPAYSAPTALVGTGGLVDGVDAEIDPPYSARVVSQFSTPSMGGNWSHVASLAEQSTPQVQKAFVYPAMQGPATVHVAVSGAPTATIKNRDIPALVVNNTVAPFVLGNVPEHALFVFTTVANVSTDISVGLSLPAAPTASPSGPGGGWLDAQPWPFNSTGAGTFKCTLTGFTSTTVFTVDAPTPPVAGVAKIAFLSPINWQLYTATVLAVSGTTGNYTITIDNPFVGILMGNYIFPQSVNQQTYVNSLLNAMALMGPGEKTSNPAILQRAFRHPSPATSWPNSLTASVLKTISNAGSEVLDVGYLYRSTTTPAVTAAVTDPPNILVPHNIGFYPLS